MGKFLERFLKVLLYGVLLLTAGLSIGTLFFWRYPLELLTHFRVYYLLLADVVVVLAFLGQLNGLRMGLLLWLALGVVGFNGVWIVPWYLPNPQQVAKTGQPIRVLNFNINAANQQWNAIAFAVRAVRPDIAAILETTETATTELAQRLEESLPFTYRSEAGAAGGMTVFSRFPLVNPQTKPLQQGGIIVTQVQIDLKQIELVVAHPIPPLTAQWQQQRNALLTETANFLAQERGKSIIFAGDLNLTPWSPFYSQWVSKIGLHNTRLGFGVEPSWVEAASHVTYPQWVTNLVKIPIDHIFVSRDLQVVDCRTFKAANSDHRMLWSDLLFKPTQNPS
jgi:endonuclease/exonuclease/phosphatase (EEP) superfamily protein YafD